MTESAFDAEDDFFGVLRIDGEIVFEDMQGIGFRCAVECALFLKISKCNDLSVDPCLD